MQVPAVHQLNHVVVSRKRRRQETQPPGLAIGRHPRGQQADADALQAQALHQFEVTTDQLARDDDAGRFDAPEQRAKHRPIAPDERGPREHVPGEVQPDAARGRDPRFGTAGCGGEQPDLIVEQTGHDQVVVALAVDDQPVVDLAVEHRLPHLAAGAVPQVNDDSRAVGQEPIEEARQEIGAERLLAADGERADLVIVQVPHVLDGLVDLAEDGVGPQREHLPGGGELHAGPGARQQACPQLLFEVAHRDGQRRLADAQQARGRCDAPLPSDGAEVAQAVQVHLRASYTGSTEQRQALGTVTVDSFLIEQVRTFCQRHGLGPRAQGDLRAFVEALVDPRLAYTSDLGDDQGPESDAPPNEPAFFEDLGRIGQGGMADVRRVREAGLDRVVAMKVLRMQVHLDWFEREARLTASLDHPGVLPIYQTGKLPDGRPYFTMREARGHTLREVLDEPAGRSRRTLVEAMRRVCETVAFAHDRGIVHRDLKPENLLLGDFGEVWVLDWGIAGPAGEVAGAGSARTMAPEQARGEPVGPTADVWSLGAILSEVLTGRTPFPGSIEQVEEAVQRGAPPPLPLPTPPELSRLVTHALQSDPQQRPADAGVFARALGDWLDGTAAREGALQTLDEARQRMLQAESDRSRGEALVAEAEALLSALPSWAPVAEKAPSWQHEEDGQALCAQATRLEGEAAELARAALQRCPDLPEGHALLAEHYRRRLIDAEAKGQPIAGHLEAQLRAHDTGAHRDFLDGTGRVDLQTNPAGAKVLARPLVERLRRREPGQPLELGRTPLAGVALPRGSWLLEVEADGHLPVRYPVHLGRQDHWVGAGPDGRQQAVRLPRPGDLGADDVYVPAGWFWSGGDPSASFAGPAVRTWLDGFVIRRFATTVGTWLAYVQAIHDTCGREEADLACPAEKGAHAGTRGANLFDYRDGRYSLKADGDGDTWSPEWPVMMITHTQALAYARWYAEREGLPWRLCTGREHEKAARGVDARLFPWGDQFDPTFAHTARAAPGRALPRPVTDFPTDESVYGVRGTAGCIRTWCSDIDADGRAENRGSYWNAAGMTGRCAARFYSHTHWRGADLGVRLARSWPGE
jgi:eukaryotic-like serine/threonine-protein kinase